MKTTWLLSIPALLGGAALAGGGGDSAADDGDVTERGVAEAGRLFRASCTTCHHAPDLSFEVDRAWLQQVADTA